MIRHPTLLRLWIAIVSIAVVAMPVSAAHLHLCFDGNEPAAAVHSIEDGDHHADEGAAPIHHDVDVSLTSHALAKKFEGSLDPSALVVFVVLVPRAPAAQLHVALPESAAASAPQSPLAIVPPPRGPPV